MIKKFRKKPVVIEAVLFDGKNIGEIFNFVDGDLMGNSEKQEITIGTLEGNMKASKGDFIIKGVNNEFYPCKPDIFDKTYDEV